MQIIKKRDNIGINIFCIGVILELIVLVFSISPIVLPYASRITHIAFGLFAIKILFTYYDKKEWIAILLLGAVAAVSYLAIGEEKALRVIVMIIASKGIELKKIAEITFWTMLIAIIVVVSLALFGIGDPLLGTGIYRGDEIETRWGFGLGHANNAHGMMWYMVSLFIIAYDEKLNWKHYMGITLFNALLYCVTASRTGVIVVQLVILAAWILKYNSNIIKWKFIYCLEMIFTVLIVIGTVYAGIVTNMEKWPEFFVKINSMLTDRFTYVTYWADSNSWHIIKPTGIEKLVDNGFAVLLAKYGYLLTGIFVIANILLIFYYKKQSTGQAMLYSVIAMSCIFYTFMESTFVLNTPLLINVFYILLIATGHKLITFKESSNE